MKTQLYTALQVTFSVWRIFSEDSSFSSYYKYFYLYTLSNIGIKQTPGADNLDLSSRTKPVVHEQESHTCFSQVLCRHTERTSEVSIFHGQLKLPITSFKTQEFIYSLNMQQADIQMSSPVTGNNCFLLQRYPSHERSSAPPAKTHSSRDTSALQQCNSSLAVLPAQKTQTLSF